MGENTIITGIVVMSVQDELWEAQKEFVKQYRKSTTDLINEGIPEEKAKEIVDHAVVKNAEEIDAAYERYGIGRIAEQMMAMGKVVVDKLFGSTT